MLTSFFMFVIGTDNPLGPAWPLHPQPLPLALLSQSESRREAGLVTSLQRTSSIQGLLGQHLSGSQLSFSGSVALPPAERFCAGGAQDGPGPPPPQRGPQRPGLGLGPGAGAPLYEGLYGKWSLPGRKGFNGPAAADCDAPGPQTVRTQVSWRSGRRGSVRGSPHSARFRTSGGYFDQSGLPSWLDNRAE